jgi:hypothetical protein
LGFTPVEGRWTEEVYERRHHTFPRYVVRVYSTIPVGGAGVRGRGGDAIRVVSLFEHTPGQYRGLYKAQRVFRAGTVEGVLERMTERLRDAYRFINEGLKSKRLLRA